MKITREVTVTVEFRGEEFNDLRNLLDDYKDQLNERNNSTGEYLQKLARLLNGFNGVDGSGVR